MDFEEFLEKFELGAFHALMSALTTDQFAEEEYSFARIESSEAVYEDVCRAVNHILIRGNLVDQRVYGSTWLSIGKGLVDRQVVFEVKP
jgi:hypothetical protein